MDRKGLFSLDLGILSEKRYEFLVFGQNENSIVLTEKKPKNGKYRILVVDNGWFSRRNPKFIRGFNDREIETHKALLEKIKEIK